MEAVRRAMKSVVRSPVSVGGGTGSLISSAVCASVSIVDVGSSMVDDDDELALIA